MTDMQCWTMPDIKTSPHRDMKNHELEVFLRTMWDSMPSRLRVSTKDGSQAKIFTNGDLYCKSAHVIMDALTKMLDQECERRGLTWEFMEEHSDINDIVDKVTAKTGVNVEKLKAAYANSAPERIAEISEIISKVGEIS